MWGFAVVFLCHLWWLIRVFFCFGLLFGQKKQFEDVTLGSGKLRCVFFTLLWHLMEETIHGENNLMKTIGSCSPRTDTSPKRNSQNKNKRNNSVMWTPAVMFHVREFKRKSCWCEIIYYGGKRNDWFLQEWTPKRQMTIFSVHLK